MNDSGNGQNIEEPSTVLSVLSDAVGDLVTGIPVPVRKNAIKAFTRLCTAAVEYPVTLIEGAIAEKRAESLARVKFINTSADQIAEQMHTSPEYARSAAKKFAQKIIRERVNIDQIAEVAAAELQPEFSAMPNQEESEPPPVSDDWLNAFENEAAQASSEQMQRFFGKILAGEIRRPTSYSIRTIRIMAQLDNAAAALFKIVCSLCISMRIPNSNVVVDARVASMGGNAGTNALQPYGLSFGQLNILQEYGLIISDYHSWMDYRPSVASAGTLAVPIAYQNEYWALVPKVQAAVASEVRIHGVALTRSGMELLCIVETESNEAYTAALKNFFDQQGMSMTRLSIGSVP